MEVQIGASSDYFENHHEILWTPSCRSPGLLVTGVMVVVMVARPSSDNIPSLTSQIGLVCRGSCLATSLWWQLISSRLLISAKMYELFPSLVFSLILADSSE